MPNWLDIYKHLLPRAKSWRLTIEKQLRQFFVGLSTFPADAREFIDLVWLDIFPQETRELDQWESEFGLPDTGLTEQERRNRLDATWQAQGGQDPTYIQETLQNAGFPVYVHEWWVPGSEPAVDSPAAATPRNPTTTLVAPAYALVNPLLRITRNYISYFDGGALPNKNQFGKSDSQFGRFDALNYGEVGYTIPTDASTWPYFLYIGDSTFPNLATVDAARQEEFEALVLKVCPAQQWLGILVQFT